MRLTVGPHPAAVYWRRRGVVLVGVALALLVVMYSCNAVTGSGAPPTQAATTLLHPFVSRSHPTPTTPVPTAFTLPAITNPPASTAPPLSSGDCADSDLSLSTFASVSGNQVTSSPMGSAVRFNVMVRNTSTRTCTRDVGADQREFRLLDAGGTLVWSSTDCGSDPTRDVVTLSPGQQVGPFSWVWYGARSRDAMNTTTCGTNALKPDPGGYQVVARQGGATSPPYTLTIRAA
jgi:hypothetical protein